ncbi:MAG: hypothetical protein GY774_02525 [Planctomycetes bacterium]|nr:hypothetical protein [Planctomycetota bacterium]
MINKTINIRLKRETIEVRRSDGMTTGEIWFEIGEDAFPEESWNDFVVIILSWWIESLNNFIIGVMKEIEFSFMDGPFTIVGSQNPDGLIYLKAVEERLKGEECRITFISDVATLKSILLNAVDQLISNEKDLGLTGDYYSQLKNMYQKVKASW